MAKIFFSTNRITDSKRKRNHLVIFPEHLMLRKSNIFLNFCLSVSNDDRKKRPRTAFSASQIKALETEFERGKYLSVAKRTALAKQLRLTETQVSSLAWRNDKLNLMMLKCFPKIIL